MYRVTLMIVLCQSLWAQEADLPRVPWTAKDVVSQERTSSWQIGPKGRQALFLRSRSNLGKDRTDRELVLVDLVAAKSRTLTASTRSVSSPVFSFDGTRIYFVSSAEFPGSMKPLPKETKGAQLWELDLRGGEPRPITRVPHGVRSFQVLASSIWFLARERFTAREHDLKSAKDASVVVEDSVAFRDAGASLFRMDLTSKKILRKVREDGPISSFRVAPDESSVVTFHAQHPSHEAEGRFPPKVFVRDLSTAAKRELFADRKTKPSSVHWSPDSKGFYLCYPHSSVDGETSASVTHLQWVSRVGEAQDIDLQWPRGLSRSNIQVTDDGFLAILADGVTPFAARYVRTADGSHRKLDIKQKKIFMLLKAREADRVLYVTGGASDPDHVMVADLAQNAFEQSAQVYRPNDGFKTKFLARTEVVRFEGAEGDEIEGIVYYPTNYVSGTRYPLVLITHGGPHGADRDRFTERWANSPNLYAQRGAFVLKTNYHGSSDYGLEFGESIKGRYYELELRDMFAGIKHLVDQGKVDETQLGLVGWSNGAILSIGALTLAHLYAKDYSYRFKACAPGAGDVNWTSDYGNCAFGAVFDDYYIGGPPWKMPERYLEKSPLFHAERIETPTIIFFGTEDRAVPTSQGWELYRALRVIDKAPVRFVLFEGEGHGLRKPSHQLRKLTEELEWFDTHLFGKQEVEEIVPRKSPLRAAEVRSGYARVGERLGREVAGALVPETVDLGDLRVTRFEITVAQWQAFDPGFARGVPEALRTHPNHPATGLTAADVQAYASWLSERTENHTYRLPNEKEWKRLSGVQGPEENTLDWWVSRKPTLDEREVLRKRLRALRLATILEPVDARQPGLREVAGTWRALHGIGGNAAERILLEDGTVDVRGGCVLSTADPFEDASQWPSEFVGFRLVVSGS